MPFTGPNDETLPVPVKRLPEDERTQWVAVWNDSRDRCIMGGGTPDSCEGVAFRNANGVLFGAKMGIFDLSAVSGLRFISNQVTQVEQRTVNGRDFLISPGVLIKAAVMNDELVPLEEIQAHFSAWNGQPVVIGHPTNLDGVNISANHPPVLDALQVGRLFNVHMGDNSLKGEIWIDAARARAIHRGREVVSRLQDGDLLEVSTAYFRDSETVAGSHNGVPHSTVARNIRPDHLAILLDAQGACSLQDGCGTPRVNKKDMDMTTETDAQEARSSVRRALDTIAGALGINKEEDDVNEFATAIIDDGRLELDAAALEGMSEAALEKTAGFLAANPVAEVEPESTTDPPALDADPEAALDADPVGDPPPAVNATPCPETVALMAAIKKRGGVETVFGLLDNLQANGQERRNELVTGLVANAQCALNKAQLEALPVDTLENLSRSFIVPDYSGLGAGAPAPTGYTERVM